LVAEHNVRNVIQKFAPQELVRQASGGFGMPTPTELSPIKEALANAIYKGDSEGVRDAYNAFVAKATELGRKDPDKLAQQVLRSLNPYSLALSGHPTDAQRQDILSKLTPRDKQVLLDGESNFLAATSMLGVGSEMIKQEKTGTTPAPSRGGGIASSLPRVSLGGGGRAVALTGGAGRGARAPRGAGMRRVSLGRGGRVSGLSRGRRISYVHGKLSAPRRTRRISPVRRRRLTLA
jgi:hypothetical protein